MSERACGKCGGCIGGGARRPPGGCRRCLETEDRIDGTRRVSSRLYRVFLRREKDGRGSQSERAPSSCVRYLKRTLFCIALTARPGTVSACVQSGSRFPLAGASLPLVGCRASLRTPYSHRGGGGERVGCGPPAPAGMYPPRGTAGRMRLRTRVEGSFALCRGVQPSGWGKVDVIGPQTWVVVAGLRCACVCRRLRLRRVALIVVLFGEVEVPSRHLLRRCRRSLQYPVGRWAPLIWINTNTYSYSHR